MLKIIINRRTISTLVLIAVIISVVLLLSARIPKTTTQNERILVVASFYPVSYIAKAVGGNLVDVRNLVPSGVEAHDFEPSARDLVDIGDADILIYNGAGFEPWIKKWEQGISLRPKHIINMTDSLRLQGARLFAKDGVTDPHFWLDPVIMKEEIIVVRDLLIQIDPAHKDLFNENANRYTNMLNVLDENFRVGLSSCKVNDVVVLHKAFSYIAGRYQFTATSIAGISPDEEPSSKELARIVDLASDKGVKYIFSETVASPKFSELIAREIGGATLVLNPIESLTPDEVQSGEDYISIMTTNLNNLRTAMLCN